MDILTTVASVRGHVSAWRREGLRIAFVPTMGNLHAGHMSLIEAARQHGDRCIASIFVNPMQFGPNEDFAHYPRTPTQDAEMLAAAGCSAMFLPDVAEIYPRGSDRATRIDVPELSTILCGAARPGHFTGVLTVVAKLFHLVEPDVACFGRKDVQQLALIRRMVRDLDWPLEIAAGATVREPDGLALSSRNAYLAPDDRRRAAVLSSALSAAHDAWLAGETRAAALEARMRERLGREPQVAVEYIAIAEPESLSPVEIANADTVIAIAARVGGTRLIDNIILAEGTG